MDTTAWMALGGMLLSIPAMILLTCLRAGPQVWRAYGKHYAKAQGRLYRGSTYRQWTPVQVLIPGLLYIINGKQPFYIDEEGFEPVWKLGFWPKREND